MKKRILMLLTVALAGSGLANAQADCAREAALAYDQAKAKNYDAALPALQKIRETCPKYSMATYQYLERALEAKIDKAPEGQKEQYVEDLIEVWEQRLELYPEKTQKGKIYADIAQLKYDNKLGDEEELYEAYDKAWNEDKESFTSPKGLYAYFDLVVNMQDAGERSLQDVFDQYDKVFGKIEQEENDAAEALAPLLKNRKKVKN